MRATIQETPLNTRLLFEHGLKVHGESEIITNDGETTRQSTFSQVAQRAAQLAGALVRQGVQPGDRVATLCWNRQEHLEAYFAVPGIGAVLHPLNLRLFPEQLGWIIDHAQDRVLLVDSSLVPLLTKALPTRHSLEAIVVIGDSEAVELDGAVGYEVFLAGQPTTYAWPDVDERDAAILCYTSGTTGNPKGVAYSHRAVFLQAQAQCAIDSFGVNQRDRILLVVPMFHANAWGLPFSGWMAGADFVLPGRNLAPAHLARLIKEEVITFAQGVPTIWNDLLLHSDTYGVDLSSLRMILSGGSAVPPSLMAAYAERFGADLIQAWGMTEGGPLTAIALPPDGADAAEARHYRGKSGRILPGTEVRVVDELGGELPWDGESVGEFELRGACIAGTYYLDPTPDKFHDGWLRTGDVGTIDEKGFVQLTDRAKDVIKSGGEWISSVELETKLMAHPAVVEAAVIGVPDERWQERPLACVVLKDGSTVAAEELQAFLADQVARWWLPERWTFIPEVPKTSVGKFDKKVLRQQYADGYLTATELVGSTEQH